MSSIVFILGAGASKQCGAPLMNNFLDVASTLMLTGEAEEKKADFERVFKTIGQLQAVHSKAQLDLNNLESIFTVLELGRVIQKIPGLEPKEIPEVIASLKELIVKTLETTMLFPVRERCIFAPQPYEESAKLIGELRTASTPRQSVSVITFNYDIAIDVALHRAGFGPNYVVESGSSPAPIDLLKLHGSLNCDFGRGGLDGEHGAAQLRAGQLRRHGVPAMREPVVSAAGVSVRGGQSPVLRELADQRTEAGALST